MAYESPIICCEVCCVSCINIVCFAFAASSWAFTSFRPSNNCGYLLFSDFAYPPSPQCLKTMDVKMERSCFICGQVRVSGGARDRYRFGALGVPMHITSHLGQGSLISRGAPYRGEPRIAYTCPVFANPLGYFAHAQIVPGRGKGPGDERYDLHT